MIQYLKKHLLCFFIYRFFATSNNQHRDDDKKNRIVTHHRCVKFRRQVVTALLFFIDYSANLEKMALAVFVVLLRPCRPHLKHFYSFFFQLPADDES